MRITFIQFLDHNYNLGVEWLEPAEVDNRLVLQAVGFVVKDDGDYLSLAVNADERNGHYRGILNVVKSAIVERKEWDGTSLDSKQDEPG